MKGIVTINTDASYSYKHKVGSFSFWMVSDNGRLCKSGVLKGETKSPTHAEFKCIINALHCLFIYCKWEGINWVIVNTDSLNTMHLVQKNKAALKRYRIEKHHFQDELAGWNKWNSYIKKNNIRIEFRHVKAHTSTDTARSWVNQWCDNNAKAALASALNSQSIVTL